MILRFSLLDSGESQQSSNRSCGRLYLVNLHTSSKVVVALTAVRHRNWRSENSSFGGTSASGRESFDFLLRDDRMTGVAERYAILELWECQAKTAILRSAVPICPQRMVSSLE